MKTVSYYKSTDHNKQTDQNTGSAFWAIHGEKMSFTFFEVPPHKDLRSIPT